MQRKDRGLNSETEEHQHERKEEISVGDPSAGPTDRQAPGAAEHIILNAAEFEIGDQEMAVSLTFTVDDRAIAEIIEHEGQAIDVRAVVSEGHDGLFARLEDISGFEALVF